MLDNFIFENHLHQRFIGRENGVYLNYSELRDYSWSYDTINNRISRFHQPVQERKIPLVVKCDSEEEAVNVKNQLLEIADADIMAKSPGKVYVGDYYTKGYITSSKKSEYLIDKRYCKIDLVLTSDDPQWYREQTHVFLPDEGNAISIGSGTDYPYDYAYDYALALVGRRIVCDSVGASAFRLLIYGPATDPNIVIGGHTYAVTGSIAQGETLLIDSMGKTITLMTATGGSINWFAKRSRESYIFEPIPAGVNSVSWVGGYGFDLTVIEQRSEPRWT